MTATHIEALKIAQSALWQYVGDLQNPPTGDSLARRIAAAEAASDKVDEALAVPEWRRRHDLENWEGPQPIAEFAQQFKGRDWVPLEAAESELQFWQQRDILLAEAMIKLKSALAASSARAGFDA